MEFTHINVSKYNYCFSDHPFPAENADYPHHSEMYKYVKSYADKHKLFENIKFNTKVVHLEGNSIVN
jgi:dimethylaniline monooxygenase (N-oxide forming)